MCTWHHRPFFFFFCSNLASSTAYRDIQIAFHYILTLTSSEYSRPVSATVSHFHGGTGRNDPSYPEDYVGLGSPTLSQPVVTRRANATFVILARNSDIDGTVQSIRALEDRFNNRYGYPYVILNEVPFTEDFQR